MRIDVVPILLAFALAAALTPAAGLWPGAAPVALADDGGDGGDDGGGDDGGGDDGGGDGDGDGDGGDDGGDDGDGDGGDGGDDGGGDDDGGSDRDDRDDRDDDDGREDEDRDETERDEDDSRSGRRGFFGRVVEDLRDALNLDAGDASIPSEIVALGLGAEELRALEARGFRTLETRPLGALGATLHRLATPASVALEQALATARAVAPAAEIDLNHLYAGGGAEADWPLRLIAAEPMAAGACVRGAPIAIVDTGVDVGNPGLRGARIERRRFLAEGVDPASSAHGTAVAALLVGAPGLGAAPLAPGATLLAAEAFGMRDGRAMADAAAILSSLDWALSRNARVIGLPLAGPENRLLARGVALAGRRANLLAAAGNDGPRAGPAFPAAHPAVIAVAAVDARRRAWRGGNRGDYVELAAPGVEVVSAGATGAPAAWTGTSFAIPFAMAAMLRARAETGGDPDAARRLLAARALDLGAPGRDPMFGHGLVRAPGARCW